MKRKIKNVRKSLYIASSAAFVSLQLLALAPAVVSAATGATLSLSPATGSIVKGKTIAIGVYENGGTYSINAVQADINYSTSQLAFVGYTSSSAFNIEAPSEYTNDGSLSIIRASIAGNSGSKLVVTLTFKAIASSGTANVSFGSSSQVKEANDHLGTNVLSSTTGASYKLTAPATISSPTPSTSTASSGNTSSSSSPTTSTKAVTPKKDNTAPTISEVVVSNVTASSATVNWKTSEAATSVVMYGLDTKNLIPSSNTSLVTKHTINLVSLTAGTQYQFIVRSSDKSGNAAKSPAMSFQTVVAGATAAKVQSSSNSTKVRVAAGIAVVALAGLAIVLINMIKRRHAAAAELSRHFVKQTEPQVPQQSQQPTVIKPVKPPDENKTDQ